MTTTIGSISGDQLRALIEKIERLEAEKAEIAEFIRETFAQAKSDGFDVKVIRQVIKRRKMDRQEVIEQEELLDLYWHALGER